MIVNRGVHRSRAGPDRTRPGGLDRGSKICQTLNRGPDRSGVDLGPDRTGQNLDRTGPDRNQTGPVSICLYGLNSTPNPEALSQYNAPSPPLHLIDYQDHQLSKNFIHTKVPHMNQESKQWVLQG